MREHVVGELAGKRLFLDVSVLLAGVLEPDSASAEVLACAGNAKIVISAHVEETATAVLRAGAPSLIPEFNDGLLRLGRDLRVTRIQRQPLITLRPGAPKLSAEDLQVVSDAVGAEANFLLTHDAEIFKAAPAGMVVRAPSTIAWTPLDARNVQAGQNGSTFIGIVFPQWSSAAVEGSDEKFYFFEIRGFASAHYDAKKGQAILQWATPNGSRGSVSMPMVVQVDHPHFIAATLGPSAVLLYIDGVTRGKKVGLGHPPTNTTFHPFMSAESQHQVSGGCYFRMEGREVSVSELNRLRASQSTRLSDGELRWSSIRRTTRLIVVPERPKPT